MTSVAQPSDVIQLVERFTGQTQITTVDAAQTVVSNALTELHPSTRTLRQLQFRHLLLSARLLLVQLWGGQR